MLGICASAQAQEGVVAGTVVAAASLRPLENAEVRVHGTDQRTRTDAAGRFRLDGLQATSVVLDVRRLGYRPLSLEVAVGATSLHFSLVDVAIELDALVVTGTAGPTEARAVGNAVGTIRASEVLQAAPVTDVQQLLSARVPGVIIMPYQGNIGTGGVTRMRGVSSLSVPNEPLVYIDGIRIDNNAQTGPVLRNGAQVARINDLDPEDIDHIEIIKGPAAATLYGTEASHGVIQIITKHGTQGSPRWQFTMRHGSNWFADPAERLNWVYSRDGAGALDSLQPYMQEVAAGQPIFQNGPVRSYGANLSGGSEQVRYYLSASLGRDEGVVAYNWRRRLSTRANVSLLPSKKLLVTTSLGFVQNDTRLAQSADLWDTMTQIIWASPTGRDTDLRGFFRTTPEDAATIDSRAGIDRFIGGVRLEHRPWAWLTQRLAIGSDVGDETSSQMFPSHPDGDNGPFGGLSLGYRTLDRRRVTLATVDYSAAVSRPLSTSLRSITSVGAQYYGKRSALVQATGERFPVGVSDISGAALTSATEHVVENKTVGLYAEQQFGWKNRLFLTAALRADDNSAFGKNFNVVLYPKIQAAWVVTDERFWRGPVIDALRLRAAWGRAGQQPDVFAATRSFAPATGPGDTPTLTPLNVGNPDLQPERGEELEIGFDAGLWHDRVSIFFTHFRQRTLDAIVPRGVPPSNGFPGSQLVNVGEIRNDGIELEIRARVVDGATVGWDLGFGFSTNDGRVQSLGGLGPITLTSAGGGVAGQRFREGYPIAAYFFKKIVQAERSPTGALLNVMCDGGSEIGHQPVACSMAPEVYMGRPTPSWEGSVHTTLRLFRNLSLHGLVDFRGGHVINHGEITFAHNMARNSRAINDSSDAILLAYVQLATQGTVQTGPTGLIKGGFAKLREISVTYTFPPQWATRFGGAHASVTVAGRNLATLWVAQRESFGWKILDPEVRWPVDLGGFARAQLPQLAQFLVTARVAF